MGRTVTPKSNVDLRINLNPKGCEMNGALFTGILIAAGIGAILGMFLRSS